MEWVWILKKFDYQMRLLLVAQWVKYYDLNYFKLTVIL